MRTDAELALCMQHRLFELLSVCQFHSDRYRGYHSKTRDAFRARAELRFSRRVPR